MLAWVGAGMQEWVWIYAVCDSNLACFFLRSFIIDLNSARKWVTKWCHSQDTDRGPNVQASFPLAMEVLQEEEGLSLEVKQAGLRVQLRASVLVFYVDLITPRVRP